MQILINGKPFEVSERDNIKQIVSKYILFGYSSKEGTEKPLLVHRFVFYENQVDDIPKKSEKIVIENIIDDMSNIIEESDKKINELLLKLSSKYFNITKKDIGNILWYYVRKNKDTAAKNKISNILRSYNNVLFPSVTVIEDNYKEYIKTLIKERETLELDVKSYNDLYIKLNKINKFENFPKFEVTSVSSVIKVKTKKESLFEIFDTAKTSKNVPIVILFDGYSRYYKINNWWITKKDLDRYIKIPNTLIPSVFFTIVINSEITQVSFTNIANTDVSKEENKVSKDEYATGMFLYTMKKVVDPSIIEGYIDASISSLKYLDAANIIDRYQHNVSGNYMFTNVAFNNIALSDLITNDPLVSEFLFLNEFNTLAVSEKEGKFMGVYYNPKHDNIVKGSIRLDFRTYLEGTVTKSIIKVSRVKNVAQIESLEYVLSRIITKYMNAEQNILKFYKDIIGATFDAIEQKLTRLKVKEKTTAITKIKLNPLKQANPEAFNTPPNDKYYSSFCQNEQQPYPFKEDVYKETIAKIIKKTGKSKEEVEKDMVIEWPAESGEYYACEPTNTKYKYPNLKPLKYAQRYKYTDDFIEKFNNTLEAGNVSGVGGLPCCYIKPRKTSIVKKPKIAATHIIKTMKPLDKDRVGEAPFNVRKTINHLSCVYPFDNSDNLIRIGVGNPENSFIACLEKVINKKDVSEVDFKKIRKTLSKRDDLYICKQELYDYTVTEIKDLIVNCDYFNPIHFIRLLEEHYKCNIFLFQMNTDEQEGNILLPRTAPTTIHLRPSIDKSLPAVFILEVVRSEGKFQCELIGTSKNTFTFPSEWVDRLRTDSVNAYNVVQNQNPSVVLYKPVDL